MGKTVDTLQQQNMTKRKSSVWSFGRSVHFHSIYRCHKNTHNPTRYINIQHLLLHIPWGPIQNKCKEREKQSLNALAKLSCHAHGVGCTFKSLKIYWSVTKLQVSLHERSSVSCKTLWTVARLGHVYSSQNDVIKWKHFSRYLPFVRGIRRSPVNSPHNGQWRGALKFSLICAWLNGWINNGEAGDLKRHRAHYDATVMELNFRFEGYLYQDEQFLMPMVSNNRQGVAILVVDALVL